MPPELSLQSHLSHLVIRIGQRYKRGVYCLFVQLLFASAFLASAGAQELGAKAGPNAGIFVAVPPLANLGTSATYNWLEQALPVFVWAGLQGDSRIKATLYRSSSDLAAPERGTEYEKAAGAVGDRALLTFSIKGDFVEYRGSVKISLRLENGRHDTVATLSRVLSGARLLAEFADFMNEVRAEVLATSSQMKPKSVAVICFTGDQVKATEHETAIGRDLALAEISRFAAKAPWVVLPWKDTERFCEDGRRDYSAIYKTLHSVDAVLTGTIEVRKETIVVHPSIQIGMQGATMEMFTLAATSSAYGTLQAAVVSRTGEYLNGLINADGSFNVDLLGTTAKNAQGFLDLAKRAGDRRNPDLVAVLLERSLEKDPRLPEVRVRLGLARLGQQRFKEAESDLGEAVRLKPDDPSALEGLGDVYLAIDSYARAQVNYSRALDKGGDKARLYLKLGETYYIRGDYDHAVSALSVSRRLAPTNPRTLTDLGNAYKNKGAQDEAVESYRQALEVNPGYEEAEVGLRSIYLDQARRALRRNNYQEAWTPLDLALRHRPTSEVYALASRALIELGRYSEIEELQRRAESENQGGASLENNFGYALLQLGEREKALDHYERAIFLEPTDMILYGNKAQVLYESGKRADALAVVRGDVGKLGNTAELRLYQVKLLATFGDFEQARQILEGIDEKQLHGADLAPVYRGWGYLAVRQGQYGEAIKWYEKASASDSENPAYNIDRAFCLNELGRYEEALHLAGAVLEKHPDSVHALNQKAFALYKRGSTAEAERLSLTVVEREPNYSLGHFNRARMLAADGAMVDALTELARAARSDPDRVRMMAEQAPEFATVKGSAAFVRAVTPERNGS